LFFNDFQHYGTASGIENVWKAIENLGEKREKFLYVIDGVVININNCDSQKLLGCTAKSPRLAIAYKFEPENAQTILRDITFQVGQTGIITPVAELEPILLSRSTIARATLQNMEELKRKDIHGGDTVIVQKAGEVIPYIFGVLTEKRPSKASLPSIPENCPACGTRLIQLPEEVALQCRSISCPA
jgi:DNA ligase (NAD+)